MREQRDTADREIRIVREFQASRERLFQAWTEREHVGQWMGPNGFTTTTESMEVRPGGKWRYVMHGPDGRDYQNLVTYREVEPPARLVYAHGANEADPEQFQVTVRFEEVNGNTRLTMVMRFATKEERDRVRHACGAVDGANQTMARLEDYLKTQGAGRGARKTQDSERSKP